MYLVFLDIDGVFTSHRVTFASANPKEMWVEFDPIAVNFMNRLHHKYDVEFVLMSTWKDGLDAEEDMISHWVLAAFRNAGFEGNFAPKWKTNTENKKKTFQYDRHHEVQEYLDFYKPDDFLLFDDNTYKFDTHLNKKRLIQTDPTNGLLYKHMQKAMSIVGEWETKKPYK